MPAMEKKTVLLVADESSTVNAVKEALRDEYNLEIARDADSAQAALNRQKPDLIIIDYELKVSDGLQLFKKLGTLIKVIMLSASGSIPLAVSATKMGITEFLRRPIDPEQLRKSIAAVVGKEPKRIVWPESCGWLKGESQQTQLIINQVLPGLNQEQELIFFAEAGVPKESLAQFVHANSAHRERKLITLDAAAFKREDQEGPFWAFLQEILSLPEPTSLPNPAELCGTVYLANMATLDRIFQQSIVKYFTQRSGKIDRTIKVIFDSLTVASEFRPITIPPLRERRQDLPLLIKFYLDKAAAEYGKTINLIELKLLEVLSLYDFPGNDRELECWLNEAVLTAHSDQLELRHLPINQELWLEKISHQALQANLTLAAARKQFERELYPYLLNVSQKDQGQVAKFLDIPKANFSERLENLAD
jgi:DNA-binding NtrC family response regulator